MTIPPVAPVARPAAPTAPAQASPSAVPSAPAPDAPTPAPSAPPGAPAGKAPAVPENVIALMKATQSLDEVWGAAVVQASAAAKMLAKPDADGKVQVPGEAQRALGRLMFVGQALQIKPPQNVPDDVQLKLPDGATPVDAIRAAEATFAGAVGSLVKATGEVASTLTPDTPKEVMAGVMAVRERVDEAIHAVKFSARFIPEPEPEPTAGKPAPAGTSSGPQPAPDPAAAPAPTAQPADAPAPASSAAAPSPASAPAPQPQQSQPTSSGVSGTVFDPASKNPRLADPDAGLQYGTVPGTDPAAKTPA